MEFIVNQELPKKIDFNFEALKTELSEQLVKYNNLAVTEDSIKAAKADRAKLNNLVKVINDKKVSIKKEAMAEYLIFEEKVKELLSMINEPILAIDGQIKKFEDAALEEKKNQITEIHKEIFVEYANVVPLTKIYNNRWENATYKLKDIRTDIESAYETFNKGMAAINSLDTKYIAQVKDRFIGTLDLSIALSENTRLKQQEEALEKAKEAKEAEKAKATITKEVVPETNPEPIEIEKPQQKLITLDFRVTATGEQLCKLKEFLTSNNIKYGKVE